MVMQIKLLVLLLLHPGSYVKGSYINGYYLQASYFLGRVVPSWDKITQG